MNSSVSIHITFSLIPFLSVVRRQPDHNIKYFNYESLLFVRHLPTSTVVGFRPLCYNFVICPIHKCKLNNDFNI